MTCSIKAGESGFALTRSVYEEKMMAELPNMAKGMASAASQGPSADHIRRVFAQYGVRQSAGDVEGILALFADDAIVRDPVNAPAHQSKAALGTFFEAGFAASGGVNEMTLEGRVRIAANQAAAAFIGHAAGCRRGAAEFADLLDDEHREAEVARAQGRCKPAALEPTTTSNVSCTASSPRLKSVR